MTAPAVAAVRFLYACALGAVLGFWYGLLRPFRRKHTAAGDTAFLLGAGHICLILGFGVCGGDLRLGYFFGLGVGGFLWEWTLGRLLQPAFCWIWTQISKIWGLIWLPLKKISIFAKFMFASAKKWVTIKCNNRRKARRRSGGSPHGRKQKTLAKRAGEISPQQAFDQGGGDCRYRVVYGGVADPALGPDGH